MKLFRASLFAVTAALSSGATAQPLVDITLVDNGVGGLEVRFRPDGFFDGLFSAVVFTIRWETASGASLGTLNQVIPVAQYIPTGLSGGEQDAGGYRYQIFSGFGLTALSGIGQSWTAGTEYTLMTIPVIGGPSTFELSNDSWVTANNGNYFVSLNGVDRTGVVYLSSTGLPTVGQQGPSFTVLPNPSEGECRLTLTLAAASDVRFEVLNATGQLVWERSYEKATSTVRDSVDLRSFGAGTYVVNASAGEERFTERIIVN